jgi:hypothetical protein
MTELTPTFIGGIQYYGNDFRDVYEGLQEGVLDTGHLKVTPGAGRDVNVAAGTAMVMADWATDAGLVRCRNDAAKNSNAFETGGVTANGTGNPRVDQIVARVYSQDEGDGSNLRKWRLEVIAGTPTVGSTLDNRTGAAALPSSACRLADLLVPAGFAGPFVQNTHIRDRRPWGDGAYVRILRNLNAGGGSDYATTATAPTEIDPTNLKPRIECSGGPIRVSLRGIWAHSAASAVPAIRLWMDGAQVDGFVYDVHEPLANGNMPLLASHIFVPPAGSHRFSPTYHSGGGTVTVRASASVALTFEVEELIRPNQANDGA